MIRLVFTASDTFLGKAIRFLSNGRVSHVFIQYSSDIWGGEWVTEATFPMVLQRPAERARHNIVREVECKFDAIECLHSIRDEVGTWYSFDGLFLFGRWLLIWRTFKHKIRHPLHTAKGNLCSELIAKMFKASKVLPNTNIFDVDYTNPEMLLLYTEKNPQWFPIIKE